MDCHMTPAAARVHRRRGDDAHLRARSPDPAAPADYERDAPPGLWTHLRPRPGRAGPRAPPAPPSAPGARSRAATATAAALAGAAQRRLAAGVPASVWGINRLLRADFEPDLSPRRDLPQRRRRRHRAGPATPARCSPRDHRPYPSRRPARATRRTGRSPAAAGSTTPAAGSSPPPSTTPVRRPAPTGRERSPGSMTRRPTAAGPPAAERPRRRARARASRPTARR